ncbi:Rft-1-domain-containing protein [Gigaspora margarita]|uniref:Man(5)GlcNAc(2)-PP-dolichol translocation protein RFT1 n=1 Tax=Gigaspora margarita TaxID=4874 RepID=A0A8H3X7V7_GIGMA|nr:Rft-1-domain-containing protein [Gigaspora margarita]
MSTIKRKTNVKLSSQEDENENKSTKGSYQSESSNNVSRILSSSVSGASSLVILQLISRLATFGLHQIVLRYTDPATFGIASVQLELLLATILFLSREGFRCALMRGDDTIVVDNNNNSKETTVLADSSKGSVQKITNLSYVPIPVGIITTFLACAFYVRYATEETFNTPYYVTSVVLYGLSAFGELIIEPLYITSMNNFIFKLRVSCEGIGVIVRCIITLALTLLGAQGNDKKNQNAFGILAFAVAQFAFTLIMMTGYIGYFVSKWDISLLMPQKLRDKNNKEFWFDSHLFGLAKTFTKQSLLKHILTEGDKMLIAWLSSTADQGIYAFVVNYGSLICRILFQPLEETGRTLFSKLLTNIDKNDEKMANSQKKALFTSLKVLTTLIKFHILLGLLFICFATNYTGTLIDLLVGSVWSQSLAPLVLSAYCLYVPIMGVNGITEALVAAVATEETLSILNYWLIAFSAGFVGSGLIFMKILKAGAFGLIAANAFNLSTRIIWSLNFIQKYFLKNRNYSKSEAQELQRMLSLSNLMPRLLVLISFFMAWVVTFWSNEHIGWATMGAKIKHIGIGGFCAIIVAGITYQQERKFIQDVISLIRGESRLKKIE